MLAKRQVARMLVLCAFCGGKGAHPNRFGEVCPTCSGAGRVPIDDEFISCAFCSGKGAHPNRFGEACPTCRGKGVISVALLDSAKTKSKVHEPSMSKAAIRVTPNRVFIVHGRDHVIRDKIDLFLTKDCGLETVVMEAGAHTGRTLPEKFEEMASSCSFAVFVLSADDDLLERGTGAPRRRARQNVILEVGFFWGLLGRKGNCAFLVENHPEMELPSDIQGIGWIPITTDLAETKSRLAKELQAAGIGLKGVAS